jgi:hypothetical protein
MKWKKKEPRRSQHYGKISWRINILCSREKGKKGRGRRRIKQCNGGDLYI